MEKVLLTIEKALSGLALCQIKLSWIINKSKQVHHTMFSTPPLRIHTQTESHYSFIRVY
jgi:hypothetical protein